MFQCKPTCFPSFSVLSDRSCLRVTAGPASLDLDASVQRTLDNNLATEAYERRIKRLEQEKLELSRKLQGKYILKIICFLFELDSVLGAVYYKWLLYLENKFFYEVEKNQVVEIYAEYSVIFM